jgi:transcriptional antiterminator NusG
VSPEEQFEEERDLAEEAVATETAPSEATPEPEDEDTAEDLVTVEDDTDDVGPLPDLDLSANDIFERFGVAPTDQEDELTFEEEEAEEEESSEQLPSLDLDEEPADVGVLPDPFADDEEEEEVNTQAWYIINCYSGYEHKVRHNLEQRIESMGMQDFIYQVVVPTVEEIELRDGKRRTVERCLYPGYLMVEMNLTDDSWYVVRNTPGVTGFVGMGNRPTPLRSEAVQRILRRMESTAPEVRATFKHGQKVRIIEGPFADFIGVG